MESVDLVWAVVGKVGRARGIRGDLFVDVITDEPERRFLPGATMKLSAPGCLPRDFVTVDSVTESGSRLILHFREIPDRTGAEEIRGALLMARVDPSERPDDDDEFYDRHLIGLDAVDETGKSLGTVADVVHLPAQDLLAVATDGGEVLVPFVKAIVTNVDLDAGTVRIADTPGLFTVGDVDAD